MRSLILLVGVSPASEYQTPGNHPKERMQHSEQGESLKSRKMRSRLYK